jgi:hypothetical protein
MEDLEILEFEVPGGPPQKIKISKDLPGLWICIAIRPEFF